MTRQNGGLFDTTEKVPILRYFQYVFKLKHKQIEI